MKEYQVELCYGYQECEDGIYHSFEAIATDDRSALEGMGEKLAELLDTIPDDDRFNWNSMWIRLPESVVERIRKDAIEEHKASVAKREKTYLDQMSELTGSILDDTTIPEPVRKKADLLLAQLQTAIFPYSA